MRAFAKSRPIKALLFCALLIAMVVVAVATSSGSWASVGEKRHYISNVWNSISNEKTFNEAIKEVGAMTLSKDVIPEWMLNEVLDESWLDGAISNDTQQVLWISKEGSLSKIRPKLAASFEAKGWHLASHDASEEAIETYVKTKGECRWILAEYAQAGKKTIVVLHIERN